MTHHPRLLCLLIASTFAAPSVMAQVLSPGNLLVSRTAYVGDASTVTVGQALSGGSIATYNGLFPNVFKNEVPDPSFGVSSPIFLDQLSKTDALISSLAVDASLVTTNFASKSELALNLSQDGKSVTFMGYKAPKNMLDVSNATPVGPLRPVAVACTPSP